MSARPVLERLFSAFASRDAEAMAACYADDALFEDPVFRLRGDDVRKMWRGLLGRARDFSVTWEVLEAADGNGRVRWTARYLYAGGRPVVNEVISTLDVSGGLVTRQVDSWDFPRWAAQALGPAGKLLGGTGWFLRSARRKAAGSLGVPPRED